MNGFGASVKGDPHSLADNDCDAKPTYRFHASAPPPALREYRPQPRWVTWGYIFRGGKWTKVPFDPKIGNTAKVSDPSTWGTFDQALALLKRKPDLAGIGIVLVKDDDLSGFDIDHCISDSGTYTMLASEIIALAETYAEVSPSGEGIRGFVNGKAARTLKVSGLNNVEVYNDGRYLTVTGDHIDGTPYVLSPAPRTLARLDQERPPEPPPRAAGQSPRGDEADRIRDALRAIPSDDRDVWVRVGMAIKSELGDSGFGLWREWSISSAKFDEADTRRKWQSFKRDGVTIGTVFGLARDHGWREERRERPKASKTSAQPVGDEQEEISDALQAWPIMQSKAMHGIVGRIALLATENSEADPVAVMATTLAYAAAEFGRGQYTRVGDAVHHSRHFNALVGQSSRARKGTSFKPVERIFKRAELMRLERAHSSQAPFPSGLSLTVKPGPLSSGEGLIYAVRDADGEGEDKDHGVTDKRLLVVEEEFGTALRMFQRQGNSLSTTLRTFWDGSTAAPMTKNNRLVATEPHVNIVGHITRPELGSLLTGTEIWNGFGNRFQWFCARRHRVVPLPKPMPDDQVEEIAQELARVISYAHGHSGRELVLSNAAQDHWCNVYAELTQDHPGILGAVTSRQEAHARRVALTYAQLDGSDRIEIVHLEAALALCRYAFDSAVYLFRDEEVDPVAQKIVEALREGPKTQNQLNELFHGHKKSEEIGRVLEYLQERGRITMTKQPTAGAPRKVWSFTR
jgi:primase-like protein/uncharacterized protein DUF3987